MARVTTEVAEAPAAGDETRALAALAASGRRLLETVSLVHGLAAVADAAATAARADLAVLRLPGDDGSLVARAVSSTSEAAAAGLRGSRTRDTGIALTGPTAAAAEQLGAETVLTVPVALEGSREDGVLELARAGAPFSAVERLAARLAADQAALAVRICVDRPGPRLDDPVELVGDALAAASDEQAAEDRIARLAARATGAGAAWLWLAADGDVVPAAGEGDPRLAELARSVIEHPEPLGVHRLNGSTVVTLQLGQPPLGVLQLGFGEHWELDDALERRLASFGVRAAHALRAGERARRVAGELERSRALLEVIGQAIAELSLAHTLETAVDRVGELLGTQRVAVYLDDRGRLSASAARGLDGPHELVAARLLELALGPARARGYTHVADLRQDARFADLEEAVAEAGLRAAVAAPLVAAGTTIGLLAAFPPRRRPPSESEAALLVALGVTLAAAVQNAQLHERATSLAQERERALAAERESARRLGALYEISRSFAPSLSLEATLEALAATVAGSLEVDAAAILLPDARGAQLEPHAVHVSDSRLDEVARTILGRPQPLASPQLRRMLREGEPLLLDAESAAGLGGAFAVLAPLLERGTSAALVPIAVPGEVLAALTIVSFNPDRPVAEATVAAAFSIAGQAALAIDNARLYQQQKAFADTMQRSLLPRSAPHLPGLELGDVYESSARVDVGGDVYDYLSLPDGRLAVVLGDVTGHGVDATADMAMAKFVFRSLARERIDPGAFLAAANEVVVDEIAPGKFITMVALLVDPERGRLAVAGAGHPAPRLVLPDGSVQGLEVRGLALGIDADQAYEPVEVPFELGAVVVAYTDGVVEARRDGELFGVERLDALLAQRRDLPAVELARAVIEECRAWAGGELTDDCAVVVIRRVP